MQSAQVRAVLALLSQQPLRLWRAKVALFLCASFEGDSCIFGLIAGRSGKKTDSLLEDAPGGCRRCSNASEVQKLSTVEKSKLAVRQRKFRDRSRLATPVTRCQLNATIVFSFLRAFQSALCSALAVFHSKSFRSHLGSTGPAALKDKRS